MIKSDGWIKRMALAKSMIKPFEDRQVRKGTISLALTDLIGLVERCHTFEPLWFVDPMFMDTEQNPQMYRWLTWLQLTPSPGVSLWPLVRRVAQRRLLRNPAADARARLNWRARE